jgi:hypothetical protein
VKKGLRKWNVVFLVDASVSIDVYAYDEAAARVAAWGKVNDHITLCSECSGKLDVGETYEISEITEIKS